MINRTRRLRSNENLRQLVAENHLTVNDFIAPLFVMEGGNEAVDIPSMPGQQRLGEEALLKKIDGLVELGIKSVCLFPYIKDGLKNAKASEAINEKGLYIRTLENVKKRFPELVVMTDVALDPYSSDGQDGLVQAETGEILNDQTVELLSKMALYQAQAGADLIGPSDMMDGRVGAIRQTLDMNGYINTGIISYTAKYASAFYGPFRDALDSAPKGDKKTYQMNPANAKVAIKEAQFDEWEGADIIMVKPGLPYLDIIRDLSQQSTTPVAAYNVSGEYAMIKAAAQNGWLDETKVMMESLLSFKRAGASLILTYFAEDAARELKK
jgi:porphobilinogen synthase